jgi:hypothetical protein
MNYLRLYSFFLLTVLFHLQGFSQNPGVALPHWFMKAENYRQVNIATGISEPNPDTTTAFHQATLNALINYSLFHDGVFTSLTNVGVGDLQEEQRKSTNIEYILFTGIIKGKLHPSNALKIKEKYLTPQNEAIVLIELENENANDSDMMHYSITRRAGFQKENNLFPLFIDEIDVEVSLNDSIIMKYGIIKDGAIFKNTLVNHKGLKKPDFEQGRKLFKYQDFNSSSANSGEWPSLPSSLNYGFHKSFIFNLVDQICIYNSLEIDFQLKLASANIGNIHKSTHNLSFQQLVYSLKNVQSKKLIISLSEISITNNMLFLGLKPGMDKKTQGFSIVPNKAQKKQIKKMLTENWRYLGKADFESVWMETISLKQEKNQFIYTEFTIQTPDMLSGILEGLQLAKLYISSQLATKVKAQSSSELIENNEAVVKSAKLINVDKTGELGPFYVFYQQTGINSYQLRMLVFYELRQLETI